MGVSYFDRYKKFRDNGSMKTIPGITLFPKITDKKQVYKKGKDRLDILSQRYYNSPYFGFLIMLANPEHGGLEFNIKDNSIIRIPFPLEATLEQYNNEIEKHKTLYGE